MSEEATFKGDDMLTTMWRKFLICLAILFALSIASILPMCALMFRCGCTISAGETQCNVHDRLAAHCPWCEGGAKAFLPGYLIAFSLAVGAAAVTMSRWKPSFSLGLACGIIAYGSVLSLAGLVTAKLMHYPIWFGIRI
jgi:hypothetical protein